MLELTPAQADNVIRVSSWPARRADPHAEHDYSVHTAECAGNDEDDADPWASAVFWRGYGLVAVLVVMCAALIAWI